MLRGFVSKRLQAAGKWCKGYSTHLTGAELSDFLPKSAAQEIFKE
jgi:hypothetical protein